MASGDKLTAASEGAITARTALSVLASLSQPQTFVALGFSRRSLSRAARIGVLVSAEDGDQVVGLAALVAQVQTIVEGSGRTGAFNAALWLGRWLLEPLPAIGGARPADLIGTREGRARNSQVLSQMQSGAYA